MHQVVEVRSSALETLRSVILKVLPVFFYPSNKRKVQYLLK